MDSILDIPDVRKQVVKIPVSLYHRLIELGEVDQNSELLFGYLFEKFPKSPLHSFIVKKLLELLNRSIDSSSHFVRKEDPLTLHDSEPEPDLAVVENSDDEYRLEHPKTANLVIEVAISSVKIDQGKAAFYAEADVAEYWIVRPEDEKIDVYRNPVAGEYTETLTVPASDELVSSQFETLRIKLADILS